MPRGKSKRTASAAVSQSLAFYIFHMPVHFHTTTFHLISINAYDVYFISPRVFTHERQSMTTGAYRDTCQWNIKI